MKKQIRNIVILSVIFVAIALTSLTCQLGFDRALNLLRTLASVGTFIIAVYAFDQFGLKRSRKIKEVELVREFYEKLKHVVIYGNTLNTMYGEKNEVTLFIRPYFGTENFETEELKKKNAVFTTSYETYFNNEITNIVENIFFPIELKNKFQFIEHQAAQVFAIEKEKWNLEENIYLATYGSDFEKVALIKPIGVPQYKFQHVLNNYKNIVSETEKYLNEHGYTVNK